MRRFLRLLASLLVTFQVVAIYSAKPIGAESGPCVGDGTSGRRIHLWYAWQTQDRYGSDVAKIRAAAAEADARLASIGGQHYRFLCSAGEIVVSKIRTAYPTLSSFKSAIRAKGYTSTSRIYNAFLPQGTAGRGDTTTDDRADPRVNVANVGPRYSVQPINADMMMHEIGHNLGAVQPSAPHSSGDSHCWDEPDIMCYDDGASYFARGGDVETRCGAFLDQVQRWDCNLDDYYNPRPRAGSYLATHWNIRNSYFLTPAPSPPPAPQNLHMTGNTPSSITMAWNAVSDPDGISLYSLEIRQGGSGDFSVACRTSARSCTESGPALWAGRVFEFRVRALDGAGTWGPYSAVVQASCSTSVCV